MSAKHFLVMVAIVYGPFLLAESALQDSSAEKQTPPAPATPAPPQPQTANKVGTAPRTVENKTGKELGKEASNSDWRGAMSATLEEKFPVTGSTGDGSDIVNPGAVLQLKKSGLVMYLAGTLISANTYKNGAITQGFLGTFSKTGTDGPWRTFVRGENFWITGIDVKDDGITLRFLSDPLPESRYKGVLKFPIAKGIQPTPEQVLATISEVLAVSPATPKPISDARPAASSLEAVMPAVPELSPVAPPPPPPPLTLEVGQTKEQVIAALGQPEKIVGLGTKQILFYRGLKVTLVGGKVTAIE